VIVSPCIKVCVMDPARRICVGCGRTLDEIARWGSMRDAERVEIMRTLEARVSRPLDGTATSAAAETPALPGE